MASIWQAVAPVHIMCYEFENKFIANCIGYGWGFSASYHCPEESKSQVAAHHYKCLLGGSFVSPLSCDTLLFPHGLICYIGLGTTLALILQVRSASSCARNAYALMSDTHHSPMHTKTQCCCVLFAKGPQCVY